MLETSQKSFDSFYLSQDVLKALEAIQYTKPTPAQCAAIPLVLAGIDMIVQSQTGSGKTAAFAIPIVEMIESNPGQLDVLVLTPTRELAQQVAGEFERLAQFKNLRTTAIYGGSSYEKQFKALETAQIVVATPGRLIDLIERKKIDLSRLQLFCLDEADEMLSMGFKEELQAIVENLPEERQSLLFSATITEEIRALGNRMLFYPEFITLSDDSVAAVDVTHDYFDVRGVGRPRDIIKVLELEEPDSAIIFANTKDDTFTLTAFLKRHGYRADVLNGDLPQSEREKTLAALRSGDIDFIVATDVAARGIDISALSHVINYTLPDSAEVYVHRTGRTGRAGKKGKAISLVAPTEFGTFLQIRKMYDIDFVRRTLPSTNDIMSAKQARALEKLSEVLGQTPALPYGGKLGMAEQLLGANGQAHSHVKFVARLLALADKVVSSDPLLAAIQGNLAPERVVNGSTSGATSAPATPVKETPKKQERAPDPVHETTPIKQVDENVDLPVTSDDSDARAVAHEQRTEADVSSDGEKRSRKRIRTRRLRGSRAGAPEDAKTQESSTPPADEQPAITSATQAPPASNAFPMEKMYLNLGRNKFQNASEVVNMICYVAGMDPEDIGEVTLESSHSFVYVRQDYFRDIIRALHRQNWQGSSITAEPARN